MGVTPKFINELVAGKVSITLQRHCPWSARSTSPQIFGWRAMRAIRSTKRERLPNRNWPRTTGWLKELPLKDMRDFGWVRPCPTATDYVQECLQYFGVASVDAWRAQYVERTLTLAAYRMSKSSNLAHGAIAAWLRQGELEAAKLDCRPFDRSKTTFCDRGRQTAHVRARTEDLCSKANPIICPVGNCGCVYQSTKGLSR